MRVRMVIFPEPNRAEMREGELPALQKDEILVKVLYSGVSVGTERWILTNKIEGTKYPLVPGYQNVGVVEDIGSKVRKFKPGDRVFTSNSKVPPDLYVECGSHMDHVICRENYELNQMEPIKLSDEVDSIDAAFLTMVTVGYNGARWKNVVEKGDLVVIIGQGMIGQMSAQCAKLFGAEKVITCDHHDKRVNLSAKHSADISVNTRKVDLFQLVKSIKNEGADVVIESAGIPQNISDLAELVKFGGKMMLLGTYHGKSTIEFRKIHPLRITLYTTDYYTREEQLQALGLIGEKKLKIKPLITHTFNSNNAADAYKMILDSPGECMAILIDWR